MAVGVEVASEIITIGDELLRGERVNTNAAFIGNLLAELSVPARWETTVGDDTEQIQHALSTALDRAHVIIISGGLGPTPDDRTKAVLADFFGLSLAEDEELLAHVEERFQKRGAKMPEESRNQALFPVGAQQITNPFGTAAGIYISREGRHIFALPGVPRELEQMAVESVAPIIRNVFPEARRLTRNLRLADIGESQLLHLLGDVSDLENDVSLSYLPHYGLLDLRLTAHSKDPLEAESQIAHVEGRIRDVAGDHVYGTGSVSLAEVIGNVLVNRAQTVAVAESCTGGLVADMMTDVSGASRWLERGWITYSNKAKAEDLGVDPQLIERHGTVSEEVAAAMADGARVVARTSWGLSSTGVAGPTGGTENKPVGTVWIGVSWFDKTTVRRLYLDGDRRRIKIRATHALLYLFYLRLMDLG